MDARTRYLSPVTTSPCAYTTSQSSLCAMKQAEMEVLFMGNDGVAKWKKYYAERGIEVASAGDLDRVRKYVENLHHLEGCLLGIDMEALSN